MMAKSLSLGVALGLLVAAFVLMPVHAQAPPHPEPLQELLEEVRALRRTVEQMAFASARVQLAMGRLQIQEQRVTASLRQLDVLRQSIFVAEREAFEHRSELARMERMSAVISDQGELQALARRSRELKTLMNGSAAAIQRLRADEAELTNVISQEQGRWLDINQQLDQLDRTLRVP